MKKVFSIVVVLLLCYFGMLFYKQKSLNSTCNEISQTDLKLNRLNQRMDSIWHNTHESIRSSLAPDTDSLLVIRLTTLKQVKYITSYDYFKKMNPDLQHLIMQTGIQDSLTADQMKKIILEQESKRKAFVEDKLELNKLPFSSTLSSFIQCD
ncbi:MAG: hypothetical protein ACOYOA_13995 [Saprospiraceae bacterium]